MTDQHTLHYICTAGDFRPGLVHPVRWLDPESDFELGRQLFCITEKETDQLREAWRKVQEQGFQFCGVVESGVVIAQAALWRYSDPAWDLASVAVPNPANRLQGYGKSVSSFVTAAILETGRVPTCATGVGNTAMQRTAQSIGYHRIDPAALPAQYPSIREE